MGVYPYERFLHLGQILGSPMGLVGSLFFGSQLHCLKCALNPFTPESDQCQNSPAASQEIWHHTVWRTWLFIAYSDEKWLYYKFSLHHSHNRFLKGWENTLFELRSGGVKTWSNDISNILTLSLLSSKSPFSQPFKEKMHKWDSKNLYYNHLSSE